MTRVTKAPCVLGAFLVAFLLFGAALVGSVTQGGARHADVLTAYGNDSLILHVDGGAAGPSVASRSRFDDASLVSTRGYPRRFVATRFAAKDLPAMTIDGAQFGAKIGKHAGDYGLNTADPAARSMALDERDRRLPPTASRVRSDAAPTSNT
jgi:hypothetical protein